MSETTPPSESIDLTAAQAAYRKADTEWTCATVLVALAESIGADTGTIAALEKLRAERDAIVWKAAPGVPQEHRTSDHDTLKPIAEAIVTAFYQRAGFVKVDIHLSSVVPMGKDKDGVLHCDYGMTRVTEAVPQFTTPGPAGTPVPMPTKFNLRVNHV